MLYVFEFCVRHSVCPFRGKIRYVFKHKLRCAGARLGIDVEKISAVNIVQYKGRTFIPIQMMRRPRSLMILSRESAQWRFCGNSCA